jgi:hypothetical protein
MISTSETARSTGNEWCGFSFPRAIDLGDDKALLQCFYENVA